MNVSPISNAQSRRNLFIKYANKYMSFKAGNPAENPATTNTTTTPVAPTKKADKNMGLEILSIFPKQVVDGKTIITA